MIEIYKNLFIGDEQDYEYHVKNHPEWYVVHACKEPYHRGLLGYHGRGAPKDHPEYLFAFRGNILYLNLVDADSPDYIPKEIIDVALNFINKSQLSASPCLVHCNLGESRSPSIGLLYLVSISQLPSTDLATAESTFLKLYPQYNPKLGMRGFMEINWNFYATNIPIR